MPRVRLIVTHADRPFIEEVHFGSTPDEARRTLVGHLLDLGAAGGSPRDAARTVGAARFVFGTGQPLRIPENAVAKLDLLDLDAADRAAIESGNAAAAGARVRAGRVTGRRRPDRSGDSSPRCRCRSAATELDAAAQRAYARWMAAQPVAGVAVWAHTGRGPHLSAEQRREVLETWREALPDRVVVAGARDITMAIEARRGRADALLAFPERNDPVGYHRRLGRELPVIAFYLYEAAGGVAYDDATLHAILELPEVVGIKVATLDSVMTFQRLAALMRSHPDKLLDHRRGPVPRLLGDGRRHRRADRHGRRAARRAGRAAPRVARPAVGALRRAVGAVRPARAGDLHRADGGLRPPHALGGRRRRRASRARRATTPGVPRCPSRSGRRWNRWWRMRAQLERDFERFRGELPRRLRRRTSARRTGST